MTSMVITASRSIGVREGWESMVELGGSKGGSGRTLWAGAAAALPLVQDARSILLLGA